MLHSHSSDADPSLEQFRPPCLGTGFEQVRVLLFNPVPQDLLHLLNTDHSEKFPSKGQFVRKQGLVSSEAPRAEQFFPRFFGGGLVHVLMRFMVPLPQVTEHALKADHSVKFPLTARQK